MARRYQSGPAEGAAASLACMAAGRGDVQAGLGDLLHMPGDGGAALGQHQPLGQAIGMEGIACQLARQRQGFGIGIGGDPVHQADGLRFFGRVGPAGQHDLERGRFAHQAGQRDVADAG